MLIHCHRHTYLYSLAFLFFKSQKLRPKLCHLLPHAKGQLYGADSVSPILQMNGIRNTDQNPPPSLCLNSTSPDVFVRAYENPKT